MTGDMGCFSKIRGKMELTVDFTFNAETFFAVLEIDLHNPTMLKAWRCWFHGNPNAVSASLPAPPALCELQDEALKRLLESAEKIAAGLGVKFSSRCDVDTTVRNVGDR